MSLVSRLGSGLSKAVLLLPLALSAPVLAQDDSPVVARVNGEAITEADLAMAAQDFRQTLASLPPEQRIIGLINGIIDIRLMARAAEAAGLDQDPGAVQRLAFIRDRALRSEYVRTNVVDAVTDEAVQALYDEEMARFRTEELKASHILVASEDEAKAIIVELDGGADFATIARERSIDTGSGAQGGDLGFFGGGMMVPEFEEAAYALEVGKYTAAPIQSQFGWHIILVTETRPAEKPTLEQMAPSLRDQVAEQLFIAAIDKLRAEATIEIVAPEPAPAAPAAEAPAAETPAEPTPAQ